MCGIVGIAGRHEVEWVRHTNSTIIHRGPNDQGEYQSPDGRVSPAMRRLSIIDLQDGHQPMHNPDATIWIWIVFNGEIYNAPELRLRALTLISISAFRVPSCPSSPLLHSLPLGLGAVGPQDASLAVIASVLVQPIEPYLALSLAVHAVRVSGTLLGVGYLGNVKSLFHRA